MRRQFRVLVVDDEPEVVNLLRTLLTAEGFEVITADDALSGLRSAYQNHPDAIMLDIMMPNVDGFEVCRRLREMTEAPIIFVTAKATIEDTVRGFSVGCDDYVTKPFDGGELTSRLFACLRRASERSERGGEILFPATSAFLDCSRHELVMGDRTVYLTPKEFEVLRYLARHAGKVLSSDAILNRVWGPDRIGESHLVKQIIYHLRRKIEQDLASPRCLHTIRGEGYYFDVADRP